MESNNHRMKLSKCYESMFELDCDKRGKLNVIRRHLTNYVKYLQSSSSVDDLFLKYLQLLYNEFFNCVQLLNCAQEFGEIFKILAIIASNQHVSAAAVLASLDTIRNGMQAASISWEELKSIVGKCFPFLVVVLKKRSHFGAMAGVVAIFFEYCLRCDDRQEKIHALYAITEKLMHWSWEPLLSWTRLDFHKECRNFLLQVTQDSGKAQVFSVPVFKATEGKTSFNKLPRMDNLWVDFNIQPSTVSFTATVGRSKNIRTVQIVTADIKSLNVRINGDKRRNGTVIEIEYDRVNEHNHQSAANKAALLQLDVKEGFNLERFQAIVVPHLEAQQTIKIVLPRATQSSGVVEQVEDAITEHENYNTPRPQQHEGVRSERQPSSSVSIRGLPDIPVRGDDGMRKRVHTVKPFANGTSMNETLSSTVTTGVANDRGRPRTISGIIPIIAVNVPNVAAQPSTSERAELPANRPVLEDIPAGNGSVTVGNGKKFFRSNISERMELYEFAGQKRVKKRSDVASKISFESKRPRKSGNRISMIVESTPKNDVGPVEHFSDISSIQSSADEDNSLLAEVNFINRKRKDTSNFVAFSGGESPFGAMEPLRSAIPATVSQADSGLVQTMPTAQSFAKKSDISGVGEKSRTHAATNDEQSTVANKPPSEHGSEIINIENLESFRAENVPQSAAECCEQSSCHAASPIPATHQTMSCVPYAPQFSTASDKTLSNLKQQFEEPIILQLDKLEENLHRAEKMASQMASAAVEQNHEITCALNDTFTDYAEARMRYILASENLANHFAAFAKSNRSCQMEMDNVKRNIKQNTIDCQYKLKRLMQRTETHIRNTTIANWNTEMARKIEQIVRLQF